MALIEFKNKPDMSTPITADNLNHNFNELSEAINELSNKKKDYIYLKLATSTDVNSNDAIPYDVVINTNSDKFVWNETTHRLRAPAGKYRISGNMALTGSSSGDFALSLIANGVYCNAAQLKKEMGKMISTSMSPCILDYDGVSDIFMRVSGGNTTLLQGTYSPGNWCLIEEV